MTFTLREPSLPDASQIADLHVSCWREAYAHLLPDEFFTEEEIQSRHRMWNHILGNPRDEWTVRIAESGGDIVGFAFVGPTIGQDDEKPVRDRQLFSIYLLAAHYGSGAGQALLNATADEEPLVLWVAKDNPRAVAFYRRNRFEFDGAEQVDPGASRIVSARMVR